MIKDKDLEFIDVNNLQVKLMLEVQNYQTYGEALEHMYKYGIDEGYKQGKDFGILEGYDRAFQDIIGRIKAKIYDLGNNLPEESAADILFLNKIIKIIEEVEQEDE